MWRRRAWAPFRGVLDMVGKYLAAHNCLCPGVPRFGGTGWIDSREQTGYN